MALQITEFTEGGASFTQSATLAVLPSTTTQSVAVSGTSTQSAALSDTTRLVRIVADELPHRLRHEPHGHRVIHADPGGSDRVFRHPRLESQNRRYLVLTCSGTKLGIWGALAR